MALGKPAIIGSVIVAVGASVGAAALAGNKQVRDIERRQTGKPISQ